MTQSSDLGLSQTQLENARGIIAAVKSRGWQRKAAVIAVETALTESGMRMIASVNVPQSQRFPHETLAWTDDGLGHDHASMGMFQQQTGTRWTPAGFGSAMDQTTMDSPDGWGTPAELMDAQKSTAKFLDALARVDWQHMDNWAAAQAVQGSAFADGSNYRANDGVAQHIVDALWEDAAHDPSGTSSLFMTGDGMFMIENDKSKGGNGGICLVMATGAKVIHDMAAVAAYAQAGVPGPVLVSPTEFESYPRIGT